MSMLGKMFGFGRDEHYDRAIRLFDQGLYEEAIVAFSASRASARRDPLTERLGLFYTAEAHSNLGQCALKRGAWERAEHHFREALTIHPHYADLHFLLALSLRRRLRYADAIGALDEALKINPRFAKAHFHRGLALYASGDREGALRSIHRAVEIEPGFATEAYDLGMAAHQVCDFPQALFALEMVSATEVDDILFHNRLGIDLYRRGMYADAVEEFRKALELNPSYADVHNHMGAALSADGRQTEALDAFRKALAINPDYVEARLHAAVTLRDLGHRAEAADEFRAVLDRDPDNTVARQALADMEQGVAA